MVYIAKQLPTHRFQNDNVIKRHESEWILNKNIP